MRLTIKYHYLLLIAKTNLKIVLYIFFLFIANCSYFAQSRIDNFNFVTTTRPNNLLSTRFGKQLSTYDLKNSLYLSKNLGDFFIGFYDDYNTTLVKLNPNNIKDEQFLSFVTEYSILDNYQTGFLFNSNILSDDRKLGLNEASIFNYILFNRWIPYKSISVAPFIGLMNNRQIGESDLGYNYGAEAAINGLSISDFDIQSSSKFSNEDISPRKNTLRSFNLNLSNSFNESFKNIFSSSFQQIRKDFYFKADTTVINEFNVTNNIQSRTESNYALQDSLIFIDPINPYSFNVIGRIIWRDIDRNTRYRVYENVSSSMFDVRVKEFRLEFESSGNYKSSDFDATVRFNYSERDEKHLAKNIEQPNIYLQEQIQKTFEEKQKTESEKNNQAGRISISLNGNYKISSKDNLLFSFLHNKLTYDTPSNDNFDDRDELLSIVRLYYVRKLNPLFDFFVNLEGSINHIVYIFAERSSNNNYRRVVRLGSGGNYNGKNLSSKNLFEVSANYTVYDFEDLNPNYRSFSFRQLSYQDSSSLKLTSRLSLNFFGYVKLSEQGDFKWSSFSGKPTRDLEEIYIEPKLSIKIFDLYYSAGIRYLSLKTFMYKNNIRVKESDYRSVGPIAEIYSIINKKLFLRFSGWYEFIKTDNQMKELANLNIQMSYNL